LERQNRSTSTSIALVRSRREGARIGTDKSLTGDDEQYKISLARVLKEIGIGPRQELVIDVVEGAWVIAVDE